MVSSNTINTPVRRSPVEIPSSKQYNRHVHHKNGPKNTKMVRKLNWTAGLIPTKGLLQMEAHGRERKITKHCPSVTMSQATRADGASFQRTLTKQRQAADFFRHSNQDTRVRFIVRCQWNWCRRTFKLHPLGKQGLELVIGTETKYSAHVLRSRKDKVGGETEQPK